MSLARTNSHTATPTSENLAVSPEGLIEEGNKRGTEQSSAASALQFYEAAISLATSTLTSTLENEYKLKTNLAFALYGRADIFYKQNKRAEAYTAYAQAIDTLASALNLKNTTQTNQDLFIDEKIKEAIIGSKLASFYTNPITMLFQQEKFPEAKDHVCKSIQTFELVRKIFEGIPEDKRTPELKEACVEALQGLANRRTDLVNISEMLKSPDQIRDLKNAIAAHQQIPEIGQTEKLIKTQLTLMLKLLEKQYDALTLQDLDEKKLDSIRDLVKAANATFKNLFECINQVPLIYLAVTYNLQQINMVKRLIPSSFYEKIARDALKLGALLHLHCAYLYLMSKEYEKVFSHCNLAIWSIIYFPVEPCFNSINSQNVISFQKMIDLLSKDQEVRAKKGFMETLYSLQAIQAYLKKQYSRANRRCNTAIGNAGQQDRQLLFHMYLIQGHAYLRRNTVDSFKKAEKLFLMAIQLNLPDFRRFLGLAHLTYFYSATGQLKKYFDRMKQLEKMIPTEEQKNQLGETTVPYTLLCNVIGLPRSDCRFGYEGRPLIPDQLSQFIDCASQLQSIHISQIALDAKEAAIIADALQHRKQEQEGPSIHLHLTDMSKETVGVLTRAARKLTITTSSASVLDTLANAFNPNPNLASLTINAREMKEKDCQKATDLIVKKLTGNKTLQQMTVNAITPPAIKRKLHVNRNRLFLCSSYFVYQAYFQANRPNPFASNSINSTLPFLSTILANADISLPSSTSSRPKR